MRVSDGATNEGTLAAAGSPMKGTLAAVGSSELIAGDTSAAALSRLVYQMRASLDRSIHAGAPTRD